jgi:hypothetical protein
MLTVTSRSPLRAAAQRGQDPICDAGGVFSLDPVEQG